MNSHLWMSNTQTFVPDELMGEGWSVHCPQTVENFSVERDVFLWLRPGSPLAPRRSIESVIQMYETWLEKPRSKGVFGWLKAQWNTIVYGKCHHGIGFGRLCPTCAEQHRQCIVFLQGLKKRVLGLPKPPNAMSFTDEEMMNGAKLYAKAGQNQAQMAEAIVKRYAKAVAEHQAGDIARPLSRLFQSKLEIFIAFKVYLAWLIQNERLSEATKEKIIGVFATLHQWVADDEARVLNEMHRLRTQDTQEYSRRGLETVEQLHNYQEKLFGLDLYDYATRFICICSELKTS